MIEFNKKIVQFGFGAVGKSFFEKVSKEIKFDKDKYFVISTPFNLTLDNFKDGPDNIYL